MVHSYSCLRKYVFVLMVIGGMGHSICLLGSKYQPRYVESDRARKFLGIDSNERVAVYDRGTDVSWSSTAWQVVTNPYFVMAVNIALPVIIMKADDIRIHYWLTDEQRTKVLQARNEEHQERRIFVEMQKTELQLRKDPRWKELTFAEALANERLRQQSLRENEILLARAERENEESEVDHLRKMMQNTSPEKRTEAQEKLDAYINARIKVRLERAMGN